MKTAGARPLMPRRGCNTLTNWCIADDGWAQYFWAEQTVSREEYLANSGKNDGA